MSLEEAGKSRIRDLRDRNLVCVLGGSTLISVVEQLHEKNCGAAGIVDDKGVLIGIFSIRDLMRRVDHSTMDWHSTPISEVMTADPTCVTDDDTLSTAIEVMQKGSFRHLPRVDTDGKPLAISSVRDILAYISEHFPKEFLNLPPRPGHDAKTPWGG